MFPLQLFSREKISDRISGGGEISSPFYLRGTRKGDLKLSSKKNFFFFKETSIVCIDIDSTSYSDIQKYLENLEYIPIFTYLSYSDSQSARKFHMLYVFSEPLKEEQFRTISNELTTSIERSSGEPVIDKCGTLLSQYFNGTSPDKTENYFTGIVYNIEDIVIGKAHTFLSGKNEHPKKLEDFVNLEFLIDLKIAFMNNSGWTIDNFIRKYYYKYRYIYQTEGTPSGYDFYDIGYPWKNL